jgi:hypothetical protein
VLLLPEDKNIGSKEERISALMLIAWRLKFAPFFFVFGGFLGENKKNF